MHRLMVDYDYFEGSAVLKDLEFQATSFLAGVLHSICLVLN